MAAVFKRARKVVPAPDAGTLFIYLCAIAVTLWNFRKNIFKERKQETNDRTN